MHFATVMPTPACIQYAGLRGSCRAFHALRANWMPACAARQRREMMRFDTRPRDRPSAAAACLVGVAQNQSVRHTQDCFPNAVLNLICSQSESLEFIRPRGGRVRKENRPNIPSGAPILAAAGWKKFSPASMSTWPPARAEGLRLPRRRPLGGQQQASWRPAFPFKPWDEAVIQTYMMLPIGDKAPENLESSDT
jgi:hypothetical protein